MPPYRQPLSYNKRLGLVWSARLANPRFGWIASALVTLFLFWLRTPQSFLHPQLWAEDGSVFFSQQYLSGARALLQPYSGYLHLAPRLSALLVSPSSAVHIPALYAGASIILAMWSAATIATARFPFAWLLGATLMLPPHAGEIFGTLTNIQWLMAPALAVIICAPIPARPGARLNQWIFCLIASLTGPFSMFLAPIAVWQSWHHRRHVPMVVLCVILLCGAAVQAWLVITTGADHAGLSDPLQLAGTLLDRSIGQLANGHRTATGRDVLQILIVAAAATASFLVDRKFIGLKLFIFTAAFLASVWIKFSGPGSIVLSGVENGDRYFFVPRLMILWSIIMVIVTDLGWTACLGLVALTIITCNVQQWRTPALPVIPWKDEAIHIDRGDAVTIHTNPGSSTAGWSFTLPARR